MTAISYNLLPSCFSWSPDPRKEHVVIDQNGKIYGALTKDDPATLRQKLLALAIVEIPWTLFIRMPLRTYSLLKGETFKTALNQTKKEWKLRRQNWSFDPIQSSPPSNRDFHLYRAKRSVIELAIGIVKIVTYPLAMIALVFSALYGLINPLDGRKLFALIEDAWSRNFLSTNGDDIWLNDYIAICLQPKNVFNSRNLYIFLQSYRADHPRTLATEISRMISDEESFFIKEVPLKQLEILRQFNNKKFLFFDYFRKEKEMVVEKLKKTATAELNATFNSLKEAEEKLMDTVTLDLINILNSLSAIEKIREELATCQIEKNQSKVLELEAYKQKTIALLTNQIEEIKNLEQDFADFIMVGH